MIGQDPFVAETSQSVSIPTEVIGMDFSFANGLNTSASSPASDCGLSDSSVQEALKSPIFQNDVSGTQYVDAFQRANFYQQTNSSGLNPNYHVLLTGSNPINESITVASSAGTAASTTCGSNVSVEGGVDIGALGSFLENTLIPALASSGVSPSTFPVFLMYNTLLCDASGCGIGGFHGSYATSSGQTQTFVVADYQLNGAVSASAAHDSSLLSHEVGEWIDDPAGDNPVPTWGHVGQDSNICQNNLEPGDPLSGAPLVSIAAGPTTYHVQDLTFASWFYRQVPSDGEGGLYSYYGNFTSPSDGSVCPQQPVSVTASPGSGQATVSWIEPSPSATPTLYDVLPYVNGVAQTNLATTFTLTGGSVPGLTTGTSYTFTVAAFLANTNGQCTLNSANYDCSVTSIPSSPITIGSHSLSTGVGPRWNVGHVEQIRSVGSETTLFLTQTLSNYFAQAGVYGCNLDPLSSPFESSCLTAPNDVSATTDTLDNYDHIEPIAGLSIGGADGQKQLCGAESTSFPVDFARSSEPPSSANGCSTMVGLGFAKDGVPAVDFPGAEGPGTAVGPTTPWFGVAGHVVGPVAAGWLPGDPVTCDQGAPNTSSNLLNRSSNPRVGILADSCSGVPFEDLDDNAGPGPSTAFNIWCNTGGSASGQITDWGQLTDLTASELPGQGTRIGVPITVVGVDPGSGTEFTFGQFANSSQTNGPCSGSSGNVDANAYLGPTPSNKAENETALVENNAAQLGEFAAADFPSSDTTQTADQAALIATSLYFMSNGVYNSNIHARVTSVSGGAQYAANKMLENEVIPTTTQSGTLMNNSFPTAKTLYNIYRTDTVRASTADFLDWICDSNSLFTKGIDMNTGKSYDSEITAAINTSYGFIRLTDTTAAPNNSCQMITAVANPNS
jgi:hypothetical protein